MFFHYRQNNSGGNFVVNQSSGIAVHTIIEAESPEKADDRAEQIGLYFDPGCLIDCPCCGPRWTNASISDGKKFPHVYGQNISEFLLERVEHQASIHFADGTMVSIEIYRRHQ